MQVQPNIRVNVQSFLYHRQCFQLKSLPGLFSSTHLYLLWGLRLFWQSPAPPPFPPSFHIKESLLALFTYIRNQRILYY